MAEVQPIAPKKGCEEGECQWCVLRCVVWCRGCAAMLVAVRFG